MNKELNMVWNEEGSPLREHQKKMLELMKYLDMICRQNNISYILCAGSALGAVRHKGFIPWDDDMDIALFEKDYNRLIKILLHLNSGKYVLHCQETDFNYVNEFPKFRLKEGNLQSSFPNRGMLYKWKGPGIDIFCLQNSSKKASAFSAFVHGQLMWWTWRIKHDSIRYLITKAMYGVWLIVRPLIKLFDKINKTKEIRYSLGQGFTHMCTVKENVMPQILVDFEDTQFPVPEQYDKYLTDLYGDWRTPPSIEEITKCGIHSKELLEPSK